MIELTITLPEDTISKLSELIEIYDERCGITLDNSTIISYAVDFLRDYL